ncbi:MAG: hypothetical protein R6U44_02200, partial [Archaeoglobaceae archaeon]
FPEGVFENTKQITLNEEEMENFRKFSQDKRIHTGEAEGVTIAKSRNSIFLTNDSLVVRFCEEKEIKVLNLKDILILMGENEVVSKQEMSVILKDIENKDNTTIKGKEEIMEIY